MRLVVLAVGPLLPACTLLLPYDESLVGEICDNGVDDDDDGLVDCWDRTQCKTAPGCLEEGLAACIDGDDNDRDGLPDCADATCRELAHCLEGSDDTCGDGVDNDLDGATDCGDAQCFARFACFPGRPLVRDEPCEPDRPAFVLEDHFSGSTVDAAHWQPYCTGNAGAPDCPEVDEPLGALYLNGEDHWYSAGLHSDWFGVGTAQPLELDVSLLPDGRCHVDDRRCSIRVMLHTRETWGDRKGGGWEVLGLGIASTGSRDEYQLTCHVHGRDLTSRGPLVVETDADGRVVLNVTVESETGEVEATANGERICRGGPLLRAEPLVRLVLQTGARPEFPPGRLLFDHVRLAVEREQTLERCLGLRRPMLPDPTCRYDRYHNTAEGNPRVVRMGGTDEPAYHLLFRAEHDVNHTDIGHAVSSDGRTDWELASVDEPALPCRWGQPSNVGGVLHDPERGRLEMWGYHGGDPAALYTAPEDDPTVWTKQPGVVVAEVSPDLPQPGAGWLPRAVARADGEVVAWVDGQREDGRQAVFPASSEDGLLWTVEPEPVLEPGGPGEWDAEGVYSPSVTWTGEYWLMAYTGVPLLHPAAIGLAVSQDGRTWEKHRDNPVVLGEDDGFDDGGAANPAVLVEDGVVRIWYEGLAFSSTDCPVLPRRNDLSSDKQRRIGLTELTFAGEEGGAR